jgi:hypothetical protein
LVQTAPKGIDGTWNGTLDAGGQKLRLAVVLTKSDAGTYAGKFESLDQGATIPIDAVTIDGDNVRFEVKQAGIVYEGALNKDRTELSGKFNQGGQVIPITFTRGEQKSAPAAPAKAQTGLIPLLRARHTPRRNVLVENAGRPHARRNADASEWRERLEARRRDRHHFRVRPAKPR